MNWRGQSDNTLRLKRKEKSCGKERRRELVKNRERKNDWKSRKEREKAGVEIREQGREEIEADKEHEQWMHLLSITEPGTNQ